MSSMAGSSRVRSRTSAWADTSASTRAAVVSCGEKASRWRTPSPSLPMWVASTSCSGGRGSQRSTTSTRCSATR